MTTYRADTVIRRANVITIDPAQPRATAVAMRDGRIIGVGSDADVATLVGAEYENPGPGRQDGDTGVH